MICGETDTQVDGEEENGKLNRRGFVKVHAKMEDAGSFGRRVGRKRVGQRHSTWAANMGQQ